MGPESIHEGDLYLVVLQKDGTSSYEKLNDLTFPELKETSSPTVGEILDSLKEKDRSMLYYFVGTVLEEGELNIYDTLRAAGLYLRLNEEQRIVFRFMIDAAKNEYERIHICKED